MAPDQRAPSDSPSVVLELSHAQISEVTRSIGGTGTVPGLLSRLSALREALESVESSKRLSESLISGLFVLGWGDVAKGRVPAFGVVELLNPRPL